MKNNNIWFFGDSVTFCHGLRPTFKFYENYPDIRGKRWTSIVTEYLNGNECNYSWPGLPNEGVLHRVINKLRHIEEGDTVFIQSVYPMRFVAYNREKELQTFRPAHLWDYFENNGKLSSVEEKVLKEYAKEFIVPYQDEWETRYYEYYLGIQKELAKRGVKCIIWSHRLFRWDGITDRMAEGKATIHAESNGEIEDYHMGWHGNEIFGEFMIEQLEAGLDFIYPQSYINYDGSNLIRDFDTLYQDASEYVEEHE